MHCITSPWLFPVQYAYSSTLSQLKTSSLTFPGQIGQNLTHPLGRNIHLDCTSAVVTWYSYFFNVYFVDLVRHGQWKSHSDKPRHSDSQSQTFPCGGIAFRDVTVRRRLPVPGGIKHESSGQNWGLVMVHRNILPVGTQKYLLSSGTQKY